MWGTNMRLKDTLRELLSIWCISGESNLWRSVARKICTTVALSVVTTLRTAEPLFRFPVRTDILRTDSASKPFVGLTQPPVQDHLEIFPRGVKQSGRKLVPLLCLMLRLGIRGNRSAVPPLVFMKQCLIKLYNFACTSQIKFLK
jgi:hypothetical protein